MWKRRHYILSTEPLSSSSSSSYSIVLKLPLNLRANPSLLLVCYNNTNYYYESRESLHKSSQREKGLNSCFTILVCSDTSMHYSHGDHCRHHDKDKMQFDMTMTQLKCLLLDVRCTKAFKYQQDCQCHAHAMPYCIYIIVIINDRSTEWIRIWIWNSIKTKTGVHGIKLLWNVEMWGKKWKMCFVS